MEETDERATVEQESPASRTVGGGPQAAALAGRAGHIIAELATLDLGQASRTYELNATPAGRGRIIHEATVRDAHFVSA